MDPFTVMIFGVIGAGIALGIVVISFYRGSEKKFKETLRAVLSNLDLHWDATQETFQYQGLSFRYQKYEGSRNSSPSFSVYVECQGTGGEFVVTQESSFERFFKSLGVTREIQTQEEEFDRRFYIASDKPLFARDFFAFAEKRQAVKRVFDLKASDVTHGGNLITVRWKGSSSHTDGVAGLRDATEALAVLAKDIPPCHEVASPAGAEEGGRPANRVPVIGLAVVFLAAGLVSLVWAAEGYPVFDPWGLFIFPLKFSLSALVIFLYFSVRLLAGNSRSHRDILVAGFLALAGFLLLGVGITGLSNGMLDASLPASHTALIVDKNLQRSKNSTSYHLLVRSWRPGRALEDLKTNSGVYDRIVPGRDSAVVHTKPGKLGFEWLVSYSVEYSAF